MSVSLSKKRNGPRWGSRCMICSTPSDGKVRLADILFAWLAEARNCRHLPPPFLDGAGGYPAVILPSGELAGRQRGARGQPRSIADLHMVRETDLTAEHDKISQFAATR